MHTPVSELRLKNLPQDICEMDTERKRQKRHRKTNVDWSNLPKGILVMITDRLNLTDCLSASKVCKNWNAVLCEELPSCWQRQGFPWLLLSGQVQKENRTCTNVLQDRALELSLSKAYGKYCWGSFYDWLIMVKRLNYFFIELDLLNPFTGNRVTLPGISNFYHKMVLSGSPFESNFICMLLDSNHRELAFWVPGAKSWVTQKYTGKPFEDAIFCNGKFYLLEDNFNIWQIDATIIHSSIRQKGENHFGTSSKIELQFHEAKMPQMLEVQEELIRAADRPEEKRILKYLVESDGEILLACRYFSSKPSALLETKKFEVYSLDLFQSSWKKVESLGDRVLFLGRCSSMSLSAKKLGVGISNAIYFTNDEATPWWNEWDSDHFQGILTLSGLNKTDGREWGIFKLGNEEGKRFCFHGNFKNWAYTWILAPSWWCFRNIFP